jgi:multiple sugar transport system permease protein
MRYVRTDLAFTALGLVLLAVLLFPVYWLVASSLETTQQIFHTPPYIVPPTPAIASYGQAASVLGRYLVNSVIIAGGTVLLTLVLGAPAAYAMAHLRLRLTAALVLFLLVTQMFPAVMLATPLFVLFNRAGLVNSYLGLIIANTTTALPVVILVLRAYLLTVPFELTEAALVDGTTVVGALWRVVLPVAVPGLVTVALFAFLFAWGDFTFGLTLTTDNSIQPVTLGLYNFVSNYSTQWNDLMAGAVLTSIPAAVLLLVAQRFITAGMTAGSLKG